MKIDYLLITVYFAVFMIYFNGQILTSFYPTVAEDERGIETSYIGIIFSMFPIGWLVVSLITG